MQHPKKVQRLYKVSDGVMLQHADLKLTLFNERKDKFIQRSSDLAEPFATEWAKDIEGARAFPPDDESLAETGLKTVDVKAEMKKGCDAFQTLVFFIKMVYPNDKAMLALIGQPRYKKARNVQTELPLLLNQAYLAASKPDRKEKLLAKGMTEAEIESLNDLAISIPKIDEGQEESKKDRGGDSQTRIIALNQVWIKMVKVCECAKLIYKDDAASYAMFLLPEPPHHTPDEPAPDGPTVPSGNGQ